MANIIISFCFSTGLDLNSMVWIVPVKCLGGSKESWYGSENYIQWLTTPTAQLTA